MVGPCRPEKYPSPPSWRVIAVSEIRAVPLERPHKFRSGTALQAGLSFASQRAMTKTADVIISVACLLAACGRGSHGLLVGQGEASPGRGVGGDGVTSTSPDGPGDAVPSIYPDANADAVASASPEVLEDAITNIHPDAPVVGLTDGSQRPDATLGDTRPASTIVGDCTSQADCELVLDYRAGFECYWPTAASLTDVSRDPCLLPWTPTPGEPGWCGTATPPSDCPGGEIPVQHSCEAFLCWTLSCSGGKCQVDFGAFGDAGQCATAANSSPVDCETLRPEYLNLLAAAQECDPTKQPTTCFADYTDSCGCPAAADLTSPQAPALSCAYAALQNGNCGYGACGSPCPTGKQNPPVCVPNPTGSMGTCAMQ